MITLSKASGAAGTTVVVSGVGFQKDAYLTILRQSFCADGNDPLGLFFGATSGDVFASVDEGESWLAAARHLPPVLSVRMGRT